MLLKGQGPSFLEIRLLGYDNPGAKRDKWTINLLQVSLFLGSDTASEGRTNTYLLTTEVHLLIDWLTSIHQQTITEERLSFYYGRVWFEWLKKVGELLVIRVHFDFPAGKRSSLPKDREDVNEWFGEIDLTLTPSQLEDAIQVLTSEIAHFPIRNPKK